MLLSFLPYITETVYDEDTTYIYHNFETMKKSENSVLNNLADQINLIMIISWIIIAIGLISFIGLNIDILENHKLTAKILLLTGCSMLFLTILSFILFYFFMNHVNETPDISLLKIIDFFNYHYITLILIVLSTLSSGAYIAYISLYFYSSGKELNVQKKEKKKIKKSKEKKMKPDKKKPSKTKNDLDLTSDATVQDLEKKSNEMETWLVGEVQKSEEHKIDTEKPEEEAPIIEEDESDLKNEILQKSKDDEKVDKPVVKSPFKDEPKKNDLSEKTEETEQDTKTEESFQQALSSAIEKKQNVGKTKDLDIEKGEKTTVSSKDTEPLEREGKTQMEEPRVKEQDKEKNVIAKKFNVRCPGCKHVFIVEKNIEGVTNIKCPKCGKKGVIK
jgi:ribosomal protein S27E